MGEPARNLTDADVDAIVERLVVRLGRARPVAEPDVDPPARPEDVERIAERRRRMGGTKRRRVG